MDDQYQELFQELVANNILSQNIISQKLVKFVEKIISEQPKPVSKEDVENILYKIIFDRKKFKLNDDKEQFLRNQFDSSNQ